MAEDNIDISKLPKDKQLVVGVILIGIALYSLFGLQGSIAIKALAAVIFFAISLAMPHWRDTLKLSVNFIFRKQVFQVASNNTKKNSLTIVANEFKNSGKIIVGDDNEA